MKTNKTHELLRRLLLTLLILAIYMIGRSLLLYKVNQAAYHFEELDSQNIILSMVSGDRYRYTIFALGVMPYITSTLIIWIFMSVKGSEFKARFSPQKIDRYIFTLMLVIAVTSAISCAGDLVFMESRFDIQILRVIAVAEMVAGAVVICQMARLNKIHGIGGQTPLVLVNIVDNLAVSMQRFTWDQLQKPTALCLLMSAVVLIMEHVMVRIPIQRVSIHNAYADKSYIAFKLNPIGVMPIMFATSFFMIPQLAVRFMLWIWEDSRTLQLIDAQLNLTSMAGAVIYLGTVFALNIVFSFIMVAPDELAEQLQKAGDSIVNVYAGKKTRRYLRRKLAMLTLVSGTILCLMMGLSLWLTLEGEIAPDLALLPATAMILTGILCPLYREVKAYWTFDSYSFFI